MRKLLFVLIAGLLLSACGDSGGQIPSATGGVSSTATAKAQTSFQVGEAMKADDGRTVTVTAFKPQFKTGNSYEQASAGNECVQVTYALVNGSKQEWSEPGFQLSVIDSNGVKHQNFDSVNCGGGDNVSSLVAGGHAIYHAAYEVTAGIAIDAAWETDPFGGPTLQTHLR